MLTKPTLVKRFGYVVLWIGLGLCIVAIWKLSDDLENVLRRAGPGTLAGWFALLVLIWAAHVSAWRSNIAAFFGRSLAWRSAAKQTGLLLVGKYVPGGVFGFLARVSEGYEGESKWRHAFAGIYEQVGGLATTLVTGLVFLAASTSVIWILLGLAALPFVLVPIMGVSITAMGLATNLMPAELSGKFAAVSPDKTHALRYFCFTLGSVTGWMLLVTWIAATGFSQPLQSGIGLAGVFGISVSAGLLAVVVPGGIGVREATFISLATSWLSPPEAITMAAVLRVASVVFDLFSGLFAAIFDRSPVDR